MKGLFNLNRPHGALAQLRPFYHGSRNVNHVFHGTNMGQSVFEEGRQGLIGVPGSDGSDFEGWPKAVDQQTNRFTVLAAAEQFHHRERLWLALGGGLRGTVSPAYNPHSTLHAATSVSFTVPPH